MSIVDRLIPDAILAGLLDGEIIVKTSATATHTIKAYTADGCPNAGLGDEFVTIGWNGGARSITNSLGYFRGSLILSVYVRTQPDGRAKKKIVAQIVAQCERLVNGKSADGFHYTFDPTNVIMPTTVNIKNGYAITALNVSWHVTDKFINN